MRRSWLLITTAVFCSCAVPLATMRTYEPNAQVHSTTGGLMFAWRINSYAKSEGLYYLGRSAQVASVEYRAVEQYTGQRPREDKRTLQYDLTSSRSIVFGEFEMVVDSLTSGGIWFRVVKEPVAFTEER